MAEQSFIRRLFGLKPKAAPEVPAVVEAPAQTPEVGAYGYGMPGSGTQGYVYLMYDGETSAGDMGPARVYTKDFYTLRARSKQMYTESGVCHMVVNRFTEWVVGGGLGLKSDPREVVLKKFKINVDTETFNDTVEQLWTVYAASKHADSTGKQTLHALSAEAHRESKNTGDILVILRVAGGLVKVQHVDGDHVGNPPGCSARFSENKMVGAQSQSGYDWVYNETNNRIRHGVEIDDNGEPVAYHVRVGTTLKYERVAAKDSLGFVRAYMVYGNRTEVDSMRGTPLSSIIMDRSNTLDRYLNATVTGAEERANVPYVFEHDVNSSGENPELGRRLTQTLAQNTPGAAAAAGVPMDANMEKIATEFAVSLDRTVKNLPPGAKMKAVESTQEVRVSEFVNIHIDLICAAVKIPPSVALSKYDTSFSSSRMAGKDWEHTFITDRANFAAQYLRPIYELQVYLWLLQNMVEAPALLQAIREGNALVKEAFLFATFTGDMFPDIDPLKTANFLRTALGPSFDHVPIITAETASEMLPNGGGFDAILKQTGKELEKAKAAGLEPIEEKPAKEEPAEKENKTEKPNRKTKTRTFYGNL